MPDPAPVTTAILSDDAMRVSAFRWDVGHRDGTPPWHGRCPVSVGPRPEGGRDGFVEEIAGGDRGGCADGDARVCSDDWRGRRRRRRREARGGARAPAPA